MAYQIGFDLYESATQDLLSHVRQGLHTTAPVPSLLKDVDALTTASTTTAPATTTSTITTTSSTPGGTEEEEKSGGGSQEEEGGDAPMTEEKTLDDLVGVWIWMNFAWLVF